MRVYTQSVEAEKTPGGEKSRHRSARNHHPDFSPRKPATRPFVRKKKKKKKKREKKEKKGRETKKTREEKNERGNRWPNETLKNATNHSFFGLFVRYSDEEEFARNLVDARLETLNACLLALYITYARLLATCTLRYSL